MFHTPPHKISSHANAPRRDQLDLASQYNHRDCGVIQDYRLGFWGAGYCLDAPEHIPAGGTFGGEYYIHDLTVQRDRWYA